MGEMTSFLNLLKSNGTSEDKYRAPTFGVDQLVSQWLRQQMAYRQQMIIDLITIGATVEEIRAPIYHITSEVFRKGISWKPAFAVKCEKCATEYMETTKQCKKCGASDALREPDEDQKVRLDEFLSDCNTFDQGLEELLKEFHTDINMVDDGFIYLVKEYVQGAEKEGKPVVNSRVMEIRRLHPALVEFDLDPVGLPKNNHFVCYIHREDQEPSRTPGLCAVCGGNLVPTMYTYWHRGSKRYLLDSEVIHASHFWPSETYGWAPIMTVFEKALTLIGMDRNLYRYFFERRMPASMLMVFTDDPESLRRERENIAASMRQDPNYIPMVAVSAKGNRGRVDLVHLFHTLQEMDYLPVRQEIRERIAAMWGVTPAWQGAPDAFGGLSSQTTQLTVMGRVVEEHQRIFHEKVFPQLLEAFGVTDWKLELPQPEEKAEATQVALATQRIGAANMLVQMGFDVRVKSEDVGIDDIAFTVSGKAKSMSSMYGAPQEAAPDQYGEEPPPEEGAGSAEAPAPGGMNLMQKSFGWMQQLYKMGHVAPIIKQVSPNGSMIWFVSGGTDWIARFSGGNLLGIEKATFTKLPKLTVRAEAPRKPSKRKDEYDAEEPTEPATP